MPKLKDGIIRIAKGGFEGTLTIVAYDEGGNKIAYSPALELTGKGPNDRAAIKNLMEVVAITFDYAKTKGTLEEMLFDLGWQKPSEKAVRAPKFSDEEISRRLNVRHIKRYDEELAISA